MLYATCASMNKKSDINVENEDIINIDNDLNDLTESSQNNFNKDINYDNNIENINLTSLDTEIQDSKFLDITNTSRSKK